MNLYERIESDMRDALKKGEAAKLSVLRMLFSALKNFMIEKNVKGMEDGDCLVIIQRQIKQHKESIAQFEKGKRQDLVDKESSELKILESYMPRQMTEEEVLGIIKDAISETGATLKSEMGKVMKIVTEKTRGRADGRLVSGLVTKMLK